jgi:hypothetical protein
MQSLRPNVRLAFFGLPAVDNALMDLRLSHISGCSQGDNILQGYRGVERLPEDLKPALLVSYVYLEPFLAKQSKYQYRDWVLDSGAFSAHNSGKEIKLQSYIDCCKRLMDSDKTLTEVYSLDVIGDWKASLKNTEEMWRQGVPAIPCYHWGEPWDALTGMAKDYPKIALGGVALQKTGLKTKWAEQCFARAWPKRIHGFGYGSARSILSLPWDSVDATNWEIGPCKYGQWRSFGKMSVRGSKQNLRAEVEYYLKLEKQARNKFKNVMAQLGSEHDYRLSYSKK